MSEEEVDLSSSFPYGAKEGPEGEVDGGSRRDPGVHLSTIQAN